MAIGARIRGLREQQNLTLEDLASRVGTTKGFLSEVENGKRGTSSENLLRIAQALGASVDYLLTGEETEGVLAPAIVIPRELSEFAEAEGLSYRQTVELLRAHNSVVAQRKKQGRRPLTADDWRKLYDTIKDVFG
ncbi:MAG: helix-turn-helix domain-containing protein [Candidatus Binatia bacterium]